MKLKQENKLKLKKNQQKFQKKKKNSSTTTIRKSIKN